MYKTIQEKLEKIISDFKQSIDFAKENGSKWEHLQEEYNFYVTIKEIVERSNVSIENLKEKIAHLKHLHRVDKMVIDELLITIDTLKISKENLEENFKNIKLKNKDLNDRVINLMQLIKENENPVKEQLINQLKLIGYEEYNNIGGSIIEFIINNDTILRIDFKAKKFKKFIKFSNDEFDSIYVTFDEVRIINDLFRIEYE